MNVALETGDLIGSGRKTVNLPDHLDLIATAPDGIPKLRGLILELAVRGKLVPQDPRDEPEGELLKRIAKERTRLEADGTCKKSKATLGVAGYEQPFEMPNGWEWTRLGSVATAITKGATPTTYGHSYKDSGIRFVKVENISNRRIALANGCQFIDEETDRLLCRSRLEAGDVLFSIAGTIGKTCLVTLKDLPANTNQALAILKGTSGTFHPDFLLNQLDSVAGHRTRAKARGGAMNNVSLGDLVELVMAVPPLDEQHRIVAKVDELMALCDRLEAEQADAESAHARLVETLLGTLTQSTGAADLATNWHRLAEHFDTLFTTESSLDALKQTILQLAVMGKLVPQDPKDEPASELLKRIANERARLEAEGICKKSKTTGRVGADEQPFKSPDGWMWVRWNSITKKIGDIDHKMPDTVKEGVPYVSPRDFYPGNRIDFDGAKRISREDFVRLAAKIQPETGDIIYPRYGTIGENRLVNDSRDFLASYSCCVIKTFHGFISPGFQFYFSISECCRVQASAAENKTTQANVGIKSIQAFAVPLPPIAEQHRIVAKVDELMALCDRLKADLADARSRQARLATTLIDTTLQAA